MELKKIKCSSIDHKDINAIYYCIICKVNMCNKCETFHSKLFQNHKLINSENAEEELFTEFCQEENHNNYEIEYFCKDHNKLCCAKCIVKIKNNNDGKHSNCNICNFDEIKNEKINNFKDRIKQLENISKNVEENIKNLKNIYEKINEQKEQMKLKVQNLFTKLRNQLNKREDELLLKIDDIYDNNFIKEETIKESEKLPNKIKKLLEKSKVINNAKNLTSIFNNCINVENYIEEINNINNIINNSNNLFNKNINLKPDNDEEINKLLITINSFGKISDRFSFKFLPNLSSNYEISENGLIVTKKGNDDWDCAILGDTQIPKDEISKWKIKLKNIVNYKRNSWSILIGIAPNFDNTNNFHHKCWSFICGECSINLKNKASNSILPKERLKSGSIIEVIVDRPKGNLSFVVNGRDCGIVCNDIPKNEVLYPFVSLYDNEQIVEIIE